MTDQTITGDLSLNGNLKIDGKINTGTANANTHFLLGEKAYLGSYSGNDKNYLQMSTTSFKIENDDTLQVAGNLNAQGTFVTAGMAVQSGAVTFSDKAVYSYIDNNGVIPSIESQGSVVVNKSLSVGGTDTNYLYDVSLNANTFVAGDLSLNGNLVLNGTVTAPDNSIPASAISGATDTDYTLDISMDKTLTVGGDASFNGNVVLDKQLTVTADTHLNNRLFLGTSDSPSDAIIYGNTYVNKNLHIYGNLKVDTLENVHNLTVNEYQHITAEDLSMNGRLFVSGDVSLNDDVYIKGGLTIDGSVTAPNGSIPASAISGLVGADYTVDISMDKTLTVGGDASFNGNVVIDGTLKVNDVENNNIYNMRVTNYSLIIAEDLSLNNRLFVMQDASFNEDVHVAGDLNVDGSITNATWSGDAIADQYISSAATWNAKQSALTFGTANTNAVTIDGSTAADDSYARFTATGIEGRTPNNVKIDLGLENVTNESKATMFTSPTFTGTITVPDDSIPAAAISGTVGADYTIDISMDKTLTVGGDVSMNGDLKVSGSITDATWTGVAIADNYISSANAWNAKQDALTFSAPGDNNTNPSTSAQIKTALDLKQDTLTFSAPGDNNTNPSTSAQIKTALDLKQDTITGGATTIISTDLTNSRALVSNSSGKVAVSTVTSTELGYLDGVTSNIQTQIDSLQPAEHSTEFTVTVATKTSSHPYYGSGSTSGYKIDGIESPVIEFKSGYTYKFDQSDGSNIGHPIRFYLDADKTTEYTTSVSSNGSAGNSGAYVQIIVGDSTPTKLFYQCANHVYMGYYSVVELASTGVTNTEFGYLNDVTSAIQSQIDSKQAALTFGISDTNAVKIDGSSAVDDSYVRFTASGIEGRTTTELKTDVGLNNVTNESKSTMFDAPTFTNKVTLNGDLSLNQNLYINGDASFNGDVTIVGNLKADKIDNEYIINTETVNYTLIVAEDLSLNNRLFIQGDASFNEDVHIDGNLTVSGTVPTWNQNTTGTAAELSGTRTAKYVYAAPNDADGTASFRELVASDIPTLNQNTTGTADGLSGTHTANHVYAAPNGSNGSASFRALVNDDIPTLTGVDIDGGAIDGTAIGANSASTAKFTTLNASDATTLDGTVTLGNAAGDAVTVEGTITVKNTATFNGVIHQF